MKLTPFHLAIPVDDVAKARVFYTQTLGFEEGRSSDHWVDYNFFGHQLVIHYKPKEETEIYTNPVDGKDVPVPHFGVVLDWEQFWEFADVLKAAAIEFIIPPYIRFEGEVGEQATLFFLDNNGYAIELKAFANDEYIFKAF